MPYQVLTSLSFYLQSVSIGIQEWGDEERKDYLHHVAETTPIDASLVVCDTHWFCFSEVERGNLPILGNWDGGEKERSARNFTQQTRTGSHENVIASSS